MRNNPQTFQPPMNKIMRHSRSLAQTPWRHKVARLLSYLICLALALARGDPTAAASCSPHILKPGHGRLGEIHLVAHLLRLSRE